MDVWAKRIWPTDRLGLWVALVGLYMSPSKGGVGGTPPVPTSHPGMIWGRSPPSSKAFEGSPHPDKPGAGPIPPRSLHDLEALVANQVLSGIPYGHLSSPRDPHT